MFMLRRRPCRIAHFGSSPSRSPSPQAGAASSNMQKKPQTQLQARSRFRVRSPAPALLLIKRYTASCRRAVASVFTSCLVPAASADKKRHLRRGSTSARFGLALAGQCTRSVCAPDAIADCIEFIKRSSSASSSHRFQLDFNLIES